MSKYISMQHPLSIRGVGRFLAPAIVAVLLVAGCQPIQPEAVPASPVGETDSAATADAAVQASDTITATEAPPVVDSTAMTVAVPVVIPADVTVADVEAPAADPALVEAGLEVYRKAYCGVCHELTAAGTTGTFGPPHNGVGTIAAERVADPGYSGTAKTAEEYLYESLLHPEVYYTPGYGASMHRMPAFSHLTEAELDALVAYLMAQK